MVGLDDVVIEPDITPDRGYAMSVRGLARELSHAFGTTFRDPALAPAPTATAEPAYPVQVLDPVGCDRFAARMVRGVDPTAQSPEWMRRRLLTAGIRTISLPVDITNYLMLELGQPMHAFDAGRLTGPLVVRRAEPGERLTTLDGVERKLDVEDMVICDDSGVISLAAVMGGETSEVVAGTTEVLFEAAHWDQVMVGRTARRHKLFSEAAKRWERGVDPALPLVALDRAVTLLTTYGGGTAGDEILDINHVRPRTPISIDAGLPARRVGVDYPPARVAALLERVGCQVAEGADRLAEDPGLGDGGGRFRDQLRGHPADLAAGSDRPGRPGRGGRPAGRLRQGAGGAAAGPGRSGPHRGPVAPPGGRPGAGRERLRRGAGVPVHGGRDFDALGLPADDRRRRAVRLANPLADTDPLLRTTLLGPLLGILRRNLGRGHRDLALYELGVVFERRPGAGSPAPMGVDRRPTEDEFAAADAVLPDQPRHVAVVLAGEVEPTGWWGAGRPAGWADAVQAARLAVAAAGIPADRLVVRQGERAPWHPGRCAELVVDDVVVGYAGELHPSTIAALELPRRTSAMELDLDALPPAPVVPAPRISGFPPALIDVALVVDDAVAAADVQRALVDGAGDLLESVRLFDVYASPQLGAGRRSLAYKLTFRAPDRTLTAEEAVAARDVAVAEAARRFGATLRGA